MRKLLDRLLLLACFILFGFVAVAQDDLNFHVGESLVFEGLGDKVIRGDFFVVYTTYIEPNNLSGIQVRAKLELIEWFQTLNELKQFVENGFVKMIPDGTDCNSCSTVGGITGCTLMYCPNFVADRPKPRDPALIGVFSATRIPFHSWAREKKPETETIYHIGK